MNDTAKSMMQGWGVNKRIDIGTIVAVGAILFGVWQGINSKLNTLADLVVSDKENRSAISNIKAQLDENTRQLSEINNRGAGNVARLERIEKAVK